MFDLTDIRDRVLRREVSATEVVRDALTRTDALDSTLGAMLQRFDDTAVAAAADIDRAIDAGDTVGPLAGVSLGIKAILACREAVPSSQSLVHDPRWWKGRDAPVVKALRDAGAIIMGHTTMVEHAMGRPDPARPFPIPRNPWDVERWPGGSSSGTGIGVAAQLFLGGLGTDTAGSVRIPSAMCGITGLQTSRGLLSSDGCLPAAPSLDVIGPMARSSRDLRLLMQVLAPGFGSASTTPRRRIAVADGLMTPDRGVSPHVADRMWDALSVLEQAGYTIESVDLPEFDELVALTMTIMVREEFMLHERTLLTRWHEYGRPFRRAAVMGALLPPERYERARSRAAELRGVLASRFAAFDAVATPTWPTGALPYFDNGSMPADQTNFTAAWNAIGFPALSLPAGLDEHGMPIALQLVGPPGTDSALIDLGEVMQAGSGWHRQMPPLDRLPSAIPTIPDPDAGLTVSGDHGEAVRALRSMGFAIDGADAAVITAASRLFMPRD